MSVNVFQISQQLQARLLAATQCHLVKEMSCQVELVETDFKHIYYGTDFDKLLMTCIKKYFRSDYFGVRLSLSKAGLLKFSVFDKLRLTLQYDRTFVIYKELKIYFMSASV